MKKSENGRHPLEGPFLSQDVFDIAIENTIKCLELLPKMIELEIGGDASILKVSDEAEISGRASNHQKNEFPEFLKNSIPTFKKISKDVFQSFVGPVKYESFLYKLAEEISLEANQKLNGEELNLVEILGVFSSKCDLEIFFNDLNFGEKPDGKTT